MWRDGDALRTIFVFVCVRWLESVVDHGVRESGGHRLGNVSTGFMETYRFDGIYVKDGRLFERGVLAYTLRNGSVSISIRLSCSGRDSSYRQHGEQPPGRHCLAMST